jgi:uncharacterized membrane protein
VARLLFLGGVASVALMLAGLIDLEVHGAAPGHAFELPRVTENREAGRSVDVFVSMPALVRGLRQRPPDPVAIATAGVVVLLLTPVAGLLAALVGFARERDPAYVVIATLLIAALLFGFALRLGG